MSRSMLAVVPFVLAVPVVFGAAFVLAGQELQLVALGAGALGWLVALLLRGPVALLGMRLSGSPQAAQPLIVASSGPLEEGVRLAVVVLIGRDLGTALWIGLGWAGIEVAYSIVNGIAVEQLARRTDPEAEQARAMLPPIAFSPAAPWWGVVERIFATALHIGFTLIVAAVPAAVVATAVAHSAFNIGFVRLVASRPAALVMSAGLVVGAAALVVGLALHAALG